MNWLDWIGFVAHVEKCDTDSEGILQTNEWHDLQFCVMSSAFSSPCNNVLFFSTMSYFCLFLLVQI